MERIDRPLTREERVRSGVQNFRNLTPEQQRQQFERSFQIFSGRVSGFLGR